MAKDKAADNRKGTEEGRIVVDNTEHVTEQESAKDNEQGAVEIKSESYDELKELIDQKDAQIAEYLDHIKRVRAETENYRKRMMREQAQIIEQATQTVMIELLPVIDNLERALGAVKGDDRSDDLYKGVELIHSQIKGILEKECVETVDPAGETFDPVKHEAVMQVESGEYGENTVVEVLQKGYILKGRLLRPAMVKVAK